MTSGMASEPGPEPDDSPQDQVPHPGVVWMGDDGHLRVTVPLVEPMIDGDTETVIRSRLHEGVVLRFDDARIDILLQFVDATENSVLEIMENDELGVQIGVLLT